jgi:gliding motility-associated-like protein
MVTFRVTDKTNPIENASILINDKVLLTNVFGIATISLANNSYSWTTSATGYTIAKDKVAVSCSVVDVNISLNPISYFVTFDISDGAKKLQGATIEINDLILLTGADGKATAKLPNGNYTYTIKKACYKPVANILKVNSEDVLVPEILSPLPYSVTFTVTDGVNSITNAGVWINNQYLTTNPLGIVTCNLANGDYSWIAGASGFVNKSGNFLIACANENVKVELTPSPAQKYTVVFDIYEGKNKIPEATVEINGQTLKTDPSGKVTITLPNGDYFYSVNKLCYNSIENFIKIGDGNAIIQEFLTKTPYKVSFTVTTGTIPVPNAIISVSNQVIETNALGIATTNLVNGIYQWEVSANSFNTNTGNLTVECSGAKINVSLLRTVNQPLFAKDDDAVTRVNHTLTGTTILINDGDLDGSKLTVETLPVWNVGHGLLDLHSDGTFIYVPQPGYEGTDKFKYKVCNNEIPQECTTAEVTITIIPEEIKILQGFSPNGDGDNDFFVIPELDKYPNNTLTIINRWGNKVYEASPYRQDWDGKSNSGLTIGKDLPDGTYFVIVKKGKGEREVTGFIRLKR